jgi:hypothetical protein
MKLQSTRIRLDGDMSKDPDGTAYRLSQVNRDRINRDRIAAGMVTFTDEMMQCAVNARSIVAHEIIKVRKSIRELIASS